MNRYTKTAAYSAKFVPSERGRITILRVALITGLALGSLALVGCGGGGGSASASASPAAALPVSPTTPPTPTTPAVPSTDLQAFATVYTALEVVSSLANLPATAGGTSPCSVSGSTQIAAGTGVATYTNCVTNFDPYNAYTGTITPSNPVLGVSVFGGTASAFTIANSGPVPFSAVIANGAVQATGGLIGGALHETVTLPSLIFNIGSASKYSLGTYTIGSPAAMTRSINAGVETSTISNAAGSVTLGNKAPLQMTMLSPVIWQGSATPTSGSLQILDGKSVVLTVQFLSDGQISLVDTINSVNETLPWTSTAVQNALKYVTQ